MRLLTNGIQTLPSYHPWLQAKGNWDHLLDLMQADIICVQETKITRDKLTRNQTCLSHYDAFFSCNRRLPPKGYSGTAIFTKRTSCVPLKAEEGISGIIQSDAKKTIPAVDHIGGYPTLSELTDLDLDPADLRDLDIEGRCTAVDLGLFVLLNLYCPNITNEERFVYKMAFDAVLEARVRALIKQGRQVVVVGDMNICAQEIDHADPNKSVKDQGTTDFADHPPRQWFNKLIGTQGLLVDTTRLFHLHRKGMFTCWETRINAREGNYGTRIDYILVTPALLPWIKEADIRPDLKGSDHCPVYVDFHDHITLESGQKLTFWEQVNPGRTKTDPIPDPPTFAARFWPEFKQNLLSAFFGKPSLKTQPSIERSLAPSSVEEPSLESAVQRMRSANETDTLLPPVTSVSNPQSPATASRSSSLATQPVASTSKLVEPPTRLSASQPISTSSNKKGKAKAIGQSSIATFFSPPPEKPQSKPSRSSSRKRKTKAIQDTDDDDEIVELPPKTKRPKNPPAEESDPAELVAAQVASASAWSSLFTNAKKETPLCKVHGEPCMRLEVKKPGPNKDGTRGRKPKSEWPIVIDRLVQPTREQVGKTAGLCLLYNLKDAHGANDQL